MGLMTYLDTSYAVWPEIRVRKSPYRSGADKPTLWFYAVMVKWEGTPPKGFEEMNLFTTFGTQDGNGMMEEPFSSWYLGGSSEGEWTRICGDSLWREVE